MNEETLLDSLESLGNALDRFGEALAHRDPDEIVMDGTIQHFEFTFELFWKTLRRFLQQEGVDTASPKLADFLCFAVYSANLAYGRAYKPILEELGLTYTQYIAIVALWEEDDQTVSALGEKLFLESNTLTPILKKL